MKIATVGTSFITDNMLSAISDHPGLEAYAVYSRSMDKGRELADKHDVPFVYDDYQAMLKDPNIDIVYIASPNTLHYPQAKAALKAGKNVVLEKPFTTTKEQALDLFKTAKEQGKMIFEAITNIHTPNFALLKENLEKAGDIHQITLNFSQYSSRFGKFRDHIHTNNFDPAFDGGALTDINIYNIHLCLALFGRPEAVFYYPNLGYNGIDSSGTLIMQYPDKTAVCIGAKDSSSDSLFFIQGEKGTFKISKGSSGQMRQVDFQPSYRPDARTAEERISIEQKDHMSYEFEDFFHALQKNDQKMYEDCKNETLMAAEVLDEARKQRNIKALQEMGLDLTNAVDTALTD